MGKTSKDKRDDFYRMAKEEGWRARSAFKLLHIHEHFNILDGVTRVVDLCAAPGSWSQVLSKKLYEPLNDEQKKDVKIIAVDLQAVAPIPGVTHIQGDITKQSTVESIISHFSVGQKAQLVICDGAPDVTGLHEMDEYIQSQLLLAALNITTFVIEAGGTFVVKVFCGQSIHHTTSRLDIFFKQVKVTKPKSSRSSSIEAFVVCSDYKCPEGYIPQMINYKLDMPIADSAVNRRLVPFIACGDLSGFEHEPSADVETDSDVECTYPILDTIFKRHDKWRHNYENDRKYKIEEKSNIHKDELTISNKIEELISIGVKNLKLNVADKDDATVKLKKPKQKKSAFSTNADEANRYFDNMFNEPDQVLDKCTSDWLPSNSKTNLNRSEHEIQILHDFFKDLFEAEAKAYRATVAVKSDEKMFIGDDFETYWRTLRTTMEKNKDTGESDAVKEMIHNTMEASKEVEEECKQENAAKYEKIHKEVCEMENADVIDDIAITLKINEYFNLK